VPGVISVVLADDNLIIREGVRSLLALEPDLEPDLEIVGQHDPRGHQRGPGGLGARGR
jgi:DNA-binding NarL/FixJ family response regulator